VLHVKSIRPGGEKLQRCRTGAKQLVARVQWQASTFGHGQPPFLIQRREDLLRLRIEARVLRADDQIGLADLVCPQVIVFELLPPDAGAPGLRAFSFRVRIIS
jgi:hypothetical protein